MITAVNHFPQTNFNPNNLPPNTEAFYNTLDFASNEIHFLSSQVNQEERAQKRGLQQIRNAINGKA